MRPSLAYQGALALGSFQFPEWSRSTSLLSCLYAWLFSPIFCLKVRSTPDITLSSSESSPGTSYYFLFGIEGVRRLCLTWDDQVPAFWCDGTDCETIPVIDRGPSGLDNPVSSMLGEVQNRLHVTVQDAGSYSCPSLRSQHPSNTKVLMLPV